jgi:hypothetical protein
VWAIVLDGIQQALSVGVKVLMTGSVFVAGAAVAVLMAGFGAGVVAGSVAASAQFFLLRLCSVLSSTVHTRAAHSLHCNLLVPLAHGPHLSGWEGQPLLLLQQRRHKVQGWRGVLKLMPFKQQRWPEACYRFR